MYVIRFFAPVNDQTIQRLAAALDEMRTNECESVCLLLNTSGGSTDAGIAAYNFIKASGIHVIAVNMGVIASVGCVIYCAAERRLSMPHARFLLHPNVFNIRNESLGACQLEEKANQLKLEHEAIASIISNSATMSLDTAKKLILGHRSLSVVEAKELGIVHAIEEYRLPAKARLIAIDA